MKSIEIKQKRADLFVKYFDLLQEEFENTEGQELSQIELSSYLGSNHRSYISKILSGSIYELSSKTIQQLASRLERFLNQYRAFVLSETFLGRELLEGTEFQEIKGFYQECLRVIFIGDLKKQQKLFEESLKETYENLIFGTAPYFPLKANYFGRLALLFPLDLNQANKLLSILNEAIKGCDSNEEWNQELEIEALLATLYYLKGEVLVLIYKRENYLSEGNSKEFEEYLERAVQAYQESIALGKYSVAQEKLEKLNNQFSQMKFSSKKEIQKIQELASLIEVIPLIEMKDLEDPFGYWRNKFSN